ncbi:hypothetical protein [Halococcus salsus]|uniref:hypothetical protein n=1 Tax=Halococcus salsus TaxID=2162894 RepID=UPI0013575C2C|nr:hypothetical protein [Halococcus salsus]
MANSAKTECSMEETDIRCERCKLFIVGCLLTGLTSTVATATRFMLWNPDELAIPVDS